MLLKYNCQIFNVISGKINNAYVAVVEYLGWLFGDLNAEVK